MVGFSASKYYSANKSRMNAHWKKLGSLIVRSNGYLCHCNSLSHEVFFTYVHDVQGPVTLETIFLITNMCGECFHIVINWSMVRCSLLSIHPAIHSKVLSPLHMGTVSLTNKNKKTLQYFCQMDISTTELSWVNIFVEVHSCPVDVYDSYVL